VDALPPANGSSPISRYYLHLRHGTDEIRDPEGLDRPDVGAVRKAALEAARDMIASDIRSEGKLDFRYRIEAEDEAGNVVCSLRFEDAVRIIPEAAQAANDPGESS
jgi:hypothetical protein